MTTRPYKENRLQQAIKYDKVAKKYRVVDTNTLFEKSMGTRQEVWSGIAYWTTGKKTKEDFLLDKNGKIISKIKHEQNKIMKEFILSYKEKEVYRCALEYRTCMKRHCMEKNNYPFEYCKEHLKSEMNLTIKPTTISKSGKRYLMNGLFAWISNIVVSKNKIDNCIVFHPKGNKHICDYNGKLLTKTEQAHHHFDEHEKSKDVNHTDKYPYINRPYILKERDNLIDSSCLRGVGSFVNHGSDTNSNAKFTVCNGKACIVATKIIRNGDEIIVNYGYDPLKEFDDYTHETTNIDDDI